MNGWIFRNKNISDWISRWNEWKLFSVSIII